MKKALLSFAFVGVLLLGSSGTVWADSIQRAFNPPIIVHQGPPPTHHQYYAPNNRRYIAPPPKHKMTPPPPKHKAKQKPHKNHIAHQPYYNYPYNNGFALKIGNLFLSI